MAFAVAQRVLHLYKYKAAAQFFQHNASTARRTQAGCRRAARLQRIHDATQVRSSVRSESVLRFCNQVSKLPAEMCLASAAEHRPA